MPGRIVLLALLMMTGPAQEVRKSSHGSTVVIQTEGKNPDHGTESILEFHTAGGQKLCSLDFRSEDGDHGFNVVKADWTTNGRFFVWSMQSSGGHQAWHFPTWFYDAKTTRIHVLDEYAQSPGVSEGKFKVVSGDEIETFIYGDKKPHRFNLRLISTNPPMGSEVLCTGGATIPML